MKKQDIQPDVIYEGKPGKRHPAEQRKVLWIKEGETKFEVVANPNPHWGFYWKVGSTHQIFTDNFARWANRRLS